MPLTDSVIANTTNFYFINTAYFYLFWVCLQTLKTTQIMQRWIEE
jgi:hypothetical protein